MEAPMRPLLRWSYAVTAAAAVLSVLPGCGGGDSTGPPPDPGPAAVVIVDGSLHDALRPGQSVTLHLRNDGGPGVYKVEVWGLPTTPNGPNTFMGDTEPTR